MLYNSIHIPTDRHKGLTMYPDLRLWLTRTHIVHELGCATYIKCLCLSRMGVRLVKQSSHHYKINRAWSVVHLGQVRTVHRGFKPVFTTDMCMQWSQRVKTDTNGANQIYNNDILINALAYHSRSPNESLTLIVQNPVRKKLAHTLFTSFCKLCVHVIPINSSSYVQHHLSQRLLVCMATSTISDMLSKLTIKT